MKENKKKLYCNRCGKKALKGKKEGDHCLQFHNDVSGMFCTGKIKYFKNTPGIFLMKNL